MILSISLYVIWELKVNGVLSKKWPFVDLDSTCQCKNGRITLHTKLWSIFGQHYCPKNMDVEFLGHVQELCYKLFKGTKSNVAIIFVYISQVIGPTICPTLQSVPTSTPSQTRLSTHIFSWNQISQPSIRDWSLITPYKRILRNHGFSKICYPPQHKSQRPTIPYLASTH